MSEKYEEQYLNHLSRLIHAEPKEDRTGTGTKSIFGHQIRCDLRTGFPLLTTKKVFTKGIIHELLWFLNGDTNIKYLNENGVHIWDEWANEHGELGPVYGEMWRDWHSNGGELDQIENLMDELHKNPTSRRLIVTGWNPTVLPNPSISPSENASRGLQALPPCHTLWQLNAEEISFDDRKTLFLDKFEGDADEFDQYSTEKMLEEFEFTNTPKYYLDLQLYQRSADWFLGVPFNVASYSLLLMMIGNVANMVPRHFIHSFGDTHLYSNHIEQAVEQLSRSVGPMPKMIIHGDRRKSIDDFRYDDFEVVDYNPAAAIKAPISV